MQIKILAALAVLAFALTACGGSGSSDAPTSAAPSVTDVATAPAAEPTSTRPVEPSTTARPSCAETWVAGATLPQQYAGCDWGGEASGDEYATPCADGTKLWALEGDGGDDEFFAQPGQKVQAAKGTVYNKAFAACTLT